MSINFAIQGTEQQKFNTLSEFLINILPSDLINYIIKDYCIHKFNGKVESKTPNPLHNFIFDYYIVDLLDSKSCEFIICSVGIINHFIPAEKYTHKQKINVNWGLLDCIALANKRVIIAYNDGRISIYNLNTYTESRSVLVECCNIIFIVKIASLKSDEDNIVVASRRGNIFHLTIPHLTPSYHDMMLTCIKINDTYETEITSLVACNDGNVAFTGVNSSVQIWNPYTRTLISVLNGYSNWTSLLTCPDNNLITLVSLDYKTVKTWDPMVKNKVHSINTHGLSAIITLPDYKIATNVGNYIKIWDLLTGKLIQTIDHGSNIDYLVKTLDNKIIAHSNGSSARVYNLDGEQFSILDSGGITTSIKALSNGNIMALNYDINNSYKFFTIWN